MVVDLPDVLGVLGHSRFSNFVYRIFGLGVIRYRGRYLEKTTMLLGVLITLSGFASYLYTLNISPLNSYVMLPTQKYKLLSNFRVFIGTTTILCNGLLTNYYTKQLTSYIESIGGIDRKFAKFKIYRKKGYFYLIEIIAMMMIGCKWIVDGEVLFSWDKYTFIQFCAYMIGAYIKISIIMYNMVFIDLIYWICQRLKLINEICNSVDALTYSMNERNDTIRMLAEQHYAILEIAKRTTKLFQFTFIMSILLNYSFLISGVITVYKRLNADDTHEILWSIVFGEEFSFFNAISIIGVCYFCDQAVTQGNETKMILHKTTLNKSYVYLCPELTMFMTYLTDEILTFEPYQLFNIDNSLIVLILSNVLAFTTILIQYL